MNKGPLLFLGLFAALAVSWAVLVPVAQRQFGETPPYYDDTEGAPFPYQPAGLVVRGQAVYQDLGCAACHTQQVRRPDLGTDYARGWGERQSVARDYLYQARPQLGQNRIGPDLANFGDRAAKATPPVTAAMLYGLLRQGPPGMPAYPFLFATRPVDGPRALQALPGPAPAGRQIVPTRRAEELVAYLLSLRQEYTYPEALPLAPPPEVPSP